MINDLLATIFKPIIPYVLVIISFEFVYMYVLMIFYYRYNYYKDTHYKFLKVYLNNGFKGEYLTYKALSKYEKDGAKFLYNCYIPKGDDETTEIDVLMLHRTGIYVLESKNYSGWIFGNEKDASWTQTLPNKDKNHFYNPVKQNKTHIMWLNEMLGNDVSTSIIVFSERCTLKSITLASKNIYVIKRDELKSLMNKLIHEKEDVLSSSDLEMIYAKLKPYTELTDQEKKEHIERIKNTRLICPRCGAKLILRKAAKGNHAGKSFYGCSNFPKCRYTKEIDDNQ